MVRPSNICLSLLLPLPILFLLYFDKIDNKLLLLVVTILGFLVAISPQLYINFYHFNKISFLPAANLGNQQINWGIQIIKYATNLSGIGSSHGLFYSNPFALHFDEKEGLSWYFSNLGLGVNTIFLHIFNVFSFDYYFPYIYNAYPKYKIYTLLYSWFIIFWGIFGIYKTSNNIFYLKKEEFKNIYIAKFLLYVVIPVVFLSSLSILAISAVEVRFSLPLVLILLPFAFYSLYKNFKNVNLWIIFILFIVNAFVVSTFVDLQRNIPFI